MSAMYLIIANRCFFWSTGSSVGFSSSPFIENAEAIGYTIQVEKDVLTIFMNTLKRPLILKAKWFILKDPSKHQKKQSKLQQDILLHVLKLCHGIKSRNVKAISNKPGSSAIIVSRLDIHKLNYITYYSSCI